MVASTSGYRSIYLIGVALIVIAALQYLVLTRAEEVMEPEPETSFADSDL